MIKKCVLCENFIDQDATGEPYLEFKFKGICYSCYIELIPEIYKMAGSGDGGLIHIAFKFLLQEDHNRKKRRQLKNYQKIFKQLCHKYKFSCVQCGKKDNLSIDHITPVSKGGADEFSNLQLMCMPCNRKKGSKLNG